MAKGLKETDEAKKAEINKRLQNEVIPNNMNIFETKLGKNNGFLVGNSLTWPDMLLSILLDWMGDKKATVLPLFPNIRALDERVRSDKGIAEWIKNRPVTAS